MNDQCHDCRIRKSCYLEEPEEDWTCDSYKPYEYDEDVADNNAYAEMVGTSKAIEETAYILECIATLKSIQELGDCNTCGVKGCQYRPEWGKPVRYNCPFYKGKEEST